MKHKTFTTLYLIFALTICRAQTISTSKNNALSFELGKSGLIYNLNFDHRFQNKNFGIRFGLGSNFSKYLQASTTGGGGYYLIGRTTNSFELGIDLNYLSVEENSDDQKGVPLLIPNYAVSIYYEFQYWL